MLIIMHGHSRTTMDPRISAMPGRSTSGFHRPGRHRLHQARSAVRCSGSRMKGELHPAMSRGVDINLHGSRQQENQQEEKRKSSRLSEKQSANRFGRYLPESFASCVIFYKVSCIGRACYTSSIDAFIPIGCPRQQGGPPLKGDMAIFAIVARHYSAHADVHYSAHADVDTTLTLTTV